MFVPQQSETYHFEKGYSSKTMSRFPSGEVNHTVGVLPATGQVRARHVIDEVHGRQFPDAVVQHTFCPNRISQYIYRISPHKVTVVHPYSLNERGTGGHYSLCCYHGDYNRPQPQRVMVTQVQTRSPEEDTSGVPIAVSTATANSATLPVKREKTDSPPPPREVSPIRLPSPLPFLGYLPQTQAYINVRTTRKSIARPQCSICSKTFSRSGTLKVHMRIHTGEKPYQCKFCSKEFAQSGNLAAHERIHTGEKPYECKYCGKRFTQSSAQKSHLMTHINQQLLSISTGS